MRVDSDGISRSGDWWVAVDWGGIRAYRTSPGLRSGTTVGSRGTLLPIEHFCERLWGLYVSVGGGMWAETIPTRAVPGERVG